MARCLADLCMGWLYTFCCMYVVDESFQSWQRERVRRNVYQSTRRLRRHRPVSQRQSPGRIIYPLTDLLASLLTYFPCGRLSWHVGFRAHVKIASRIVSYRYLRIYSCHLSRFFKFFWKLKNCTKTFVKSNPKYYLLTLYLFSYLFIYYTDPAYKVYINTTKPVPVPKMRYNGYIKWMCSKIYVLCDIYLFYFIIDVRPFANLK